MKSEAATVAPPATWPQPQVRKWPFMVQRHGEAANDKLTPAHELDKARRNAATMGNGTVLGRLPRRALFLCFTAGERHLIDEPTYWHAMLRVAEIAEANNGNAGYRSLRCTDPEGQHLRDCSPRTVDASDDSGPGELQECAWCGSEWDSWSAYRDELEREE